MALFRQTILLFFFFIFVAHSEEFILILPVTKDSSSLQYLTTIRHGTPLIPIALVVDLGGPFLWLHCSSSSRGPSSSSRRLVSCRSIQCLTAKGQNCGGNVNCLNTTPGSGQSKNNICRLTPKNPITHFAGEGDLAEDVIAVGLQQHGPTLTVDEFLHSCAPPNLLRGLAVGAEGVLGLGRTRIALPSQAIEIFRRRFAICLSSSSDGAILAWDEKTLSVYGTEIWNSLLYTPLLTNQSDSTDEYYIDVKSIAVDGKRLSIRGIGAAMMSTIVPYTLMESSIYSSFVEAFTERAMAMNMTRAASVAPFEVCFRSESVGNTPAGPAVPAVDLILQSDMVKWRIHGRNSMVKVSEEAMCLGFVDGGQNLGNSMVVGGYQMEDNLVHFDLGVSMLGFSSSLLVRGSSCAHFKHAFST